MDKCCDTEYEHNDHYQCSKCRKKVGYLNLGSGSVCNTRYCKEHDQLYQYIMNLSKKPVQEEIEKVVVQSFPHNSFFD